MSLIDEQVEDKNEKSEDEEGEENEEEEESGSEDDQFSGKWVLWVPKGTAPVFKIISQRQKTVTQICNVLGKRSWYNMEAKKSFEKW